MLLNYGINTCMIIPVGFYTICFHGKGQLKRPMVIKHTIWPHLIKIQKNL